MNRFRSLSYGTLIVAGFLLSFPSKGWSSVRLQTSADPSKITAGDVVQLKISVFYSTGVAVSPSVPAEHLGSFELIRFSTGAPLQEKGEYRQDFILSLTSFEVGISTIPPVTLHVRSEDGSLKELQTPAIPIEIVSVLDGRSSDIRDIKGPFARPDGLYWMIGLLILSGAAVMIYLKRKTRSANGILSGPPRPPHETALEELDRLSVEMEESGFTAKMFYSRLSDILRVYLENRFGIPSLDRTTSELWQEMKRASLDFQLTGDVRRLLENSDLAKFAKYEPAPEDRCDDLSLAKDIVVRTVPVAESSEGTT
ncbi:MAG TPA: hypothetical protein PK876_08095 [Elusimicrobiota bacterium]|nr:hypothetical protein [Elusimicrobiota bacterium]